MEVGHGDLHMVTGARFEHNLLLRVQGLQANPVVDVQRLLTHGNDFGEAVVGVRPEPRALARNHHGVVGKFDQHQQVEAVFGWVFVQVFGWVCVQVGRRVGENALKLQECMCVCVCVCVCVNMWCVCDCASLEKAKLNTFALT